MRSFITETSSFCVPANVEIDSQVGQCIRLGYDTGVQLFVATA